MSCTSGRRTSRCSAGAAGGALAAGCAGAAEVAAVYRTSTPGESEVVALPDAQRTLLHGVRGDEDPNVDAAALRADVVAEVHVPQALVRCRVHEHAVHRVAPGVPAGSR